MPQTLEELLIAQIHWPGQCLVGHQVNTVVNRQIINSGDDDSAGYYQVGVVIFLWSTICS
jgi:hypothetical protein